MVKYIWVTSGIKNAYYQIDKNSKTRIQIPSIPTFGKKVQKYKYVKGGRLQSEDPADDPIKQQYFDLEKVSDSDLTKRFKWAH